jgi:hypothetical protein
MGYRGNIVARHRRCIENIPAKANEIKCNIIYYILY